MRYLSFIRRFKYILLAFLSIGLLIGNYFAFSNLISTCGDGYQVWNNTTALYMGQSNKKEDNDCYTYYDKYVSFTLDDSDSTIALNAHVYQFIDDVNYSNKSLINPKNVEKGQFKVLKGNEIAISTKAASKYNLDLEDSVYLDGLTAYKVKFIFKYVYGIIDASIYSEDDILLIGSSSEFLAKDHTYMTFNNEIGLYKEIYHFQSLKKGFLTNFILFSGIYTVINLIIYTLLCVLFNKEKVSNLKMQMREGNMKTYYKDLFLIDVFNLFIPFAISSLVSFYFVPLSMVISNAILFGLFYIFEIIYLRAKSS